MITAACLISTAAWAGKQDTPSWRVVRDSMRAGFERHDLAGYLAAWHSSAVLIGGRSAKAGPHDFQLSYPQIRESKRLRFAAKVPSGVTLKMTLKSFAVKGADVVIHCESVVSGAQFSETVGEIYRLRKFDGKWRIVANRFWPVTSTVSGKTARYDAAYWKQADQRLKQLKTSDFAGRIHLLGTGWRFADALKVSQAWTSKAPRNVNAWSAVGQFAMIVGRSQLAIRAYRQVHRLDAKRWIPDHVKALIKKTP